MNNESIFLANVKYNRNKFPDSERFAH